jgi:hypothetical protein
MVALVTGWPGKSRWRSRTVFRIDSVLRRLPPSSSLSSAASSEMVHESPANERKYENWHF